MPAPIGRPDLSLLSMLNPIFWIKLLLGFIFTPTVLALLLVLLFVAGVFFGGPYIQVAKVDGVTRSNSAEQRHARPNDAEQRRGEHAPGRSSSSGRDRSASVRSATETGLWLQSSRSRSSSVPARLF